MVDSFARMQARTRRFTLGAPRTVTVSPDGTRVVFLRSQGPTDPVTCLWVLDVATGRERLVADPQALAPAEQELAPEERARRERAREQAGGVVGYSVDRAVTSAVFALSGQLYLAALDGGGPVRALESPDAVLDPRLDPTGARVGYVSDGALRVHELATGHDTVLAAPHALPDACAPPPAARDVHKQPCAGGGGVSYGLAEFIAAEELGRRRGYWWSPDGAALLVARVDDTPVPRWHLADPAQPEHYPVTVAYPAAGAPNARVDLRILSLDGASTPIHWGDEEYLATAGWDDHAVLLSVLTRDQRTLRVLAVDPATGTGTVLATDTDPDWVELIPGVPARLDDGALLRTRDLDDTRRLTVDDEPVTPPGVQVRAVNGIDGDTVLYTASTEPTRLDLYRYRRGGQPELLTPSPGVYDGHQAGGTSVITARTPDITRGATTVFGADGSATEIGSLAQDPQLEPRLTRTTAGPRELATALLLPSWHEPGQRLPVLLDPYGGPHAQRVLAAAGTYLTSQWFAEQGFAVVLVDGRGTPGRGPAFERAVAGDLATPVLDDQVEALHALAAARDELDLTRVAIRGWSFGGYLAALAVLRRPEVVHAAVAGAPVTDWRRYDTAYTERYLGQPDHNPDAYERSSLVRDASALTRPLMLIHGLADDNVVAAHTLGLSSALLAAGRPHTVLPLSGVTHMTPQEVVAENLLHLQVEFLRSALGESGVR